MHLVFQDPQIICCEISFPQLVTDMHILRLQTHSIGEKIFLPLILKGLPVLFNIYLISIYLQFYHLYLSQTSVDVRSVALIFADCCSTLWTFFQFYGQLLSFICLLVVIHPHVYVHGCLFNDVSTVFKLNEVGLRVILIPKENLCDLIMITDATFAWTFVSTQTNTRVAAIQDLGTGLGAWRTIAWLMAKLTAALVRALPSAGLNARNAGLSTLFHTLAVDAAIFAWSLTWGTITSARLPAHVRAYQETLTLVKTCLMKLSLITFATRTATRMVTF